MKRNMIRILIVIGFVVVSFLLFTFGKQYEILIDNKTVSLDGTEYPAEYTINYSFDGGEYEELKIKKRKKANVVGPNHFITVEYTDETGETVSMEKPFSLGLSEGTIIVNLPVLIESKDGWLVRE